MRTDVRILRGAHRGRQGWISGTLEDRAARGITKAIVKFDGAPAEVLATSSLTTNAEKPAARREARRRSDDQLILIM